jgi:hypothetical protein
LRRLLAAFLLPLLAAASAAAFEPAATSVPLNPENPAQERIGRLRYLGGVELRSDERNFGGLSGLSVEADRLLAVSDRGLWLRARILLDDAGRLAGLTEAELAPLLDPQGRAVPPSGPLGDAEALTRAPDGSYVVSFERRHRLWRYAGAEPMAAPAQPIAAPRAIFALPSNGGFEAVSALPDGRLLLIAEGARDRRGDFVAWLLEADRAAGLTYAATGEFKPTDAAALPNGDVLVLERRFTGLVGGFAARVALLRAADLLAGARVEGEQIALIERPLTLDNFEGLALSRAADGGTLVWLLTDDNFNTLFQRTLLLLFRLD